MGRVSRTAKGTGPRPRREEPAETPTAPLGERARGRLGIWWWPAAFAAGSVVATTALALTGAPYPWLYGTAVAAAMSASAAARHRLSTSLGPATSWAAIGLVWAAILAAIALAAPGACIDGNAQPVACTAPEVATWASLGPIVTLTILAATALWRVASKVLGVGARVGAGAVAAGRSEVRSAWVLRAAAMLAGAAVAGAVAAAVGAHGGIIITAAAAGAAISPIVSPFRFNDKRSDTRKGSKR